ncbi:MAG: hypothetical protein QNJ12_15645 [Ilumatobacter sp.]|uniref:hypothetical protein n=1 Tax=Ilumatobacter sp. TaxID=1967498 RepID=UPI002607558F|nr:hypothetical protein [Ilumatobacter sp.]MDJ0770234.1 hypothetical protein [Ilumatobacter sp.]
MDDDRAIAEEPGEPDLLDRVFGEDERAAAAHAESLIVHEERLAEQRRSAIDAGRRKGGVAGAAMAGAMLAVAEIYEGPRKDDAPVTVEASGDPHDLDKDGLDVSVGDVDVAAPPLERIDPAVDDRKRPQV